jgi:lysyl-tRNA synthetase class 2
MAALKLQTNSMVSNLDFLCRPVVAGDPLLLAALDSGLPACAGVAVGFERLQMIYEQVDDIAKVVTFAARNADA